MDLRQLEYFVAVADERHFTRAAQRLGVVQSGLSQAIRTLEEELGGPLLVRSTRRVELTPAGGVLLQEARRVLAAARDARLAVTQVHGLARGQLRIGSIQSLAPFVDLPASLGRFREKFPGIAVQLVLDGAAPLLDELDGERFDVVFTQPGHTSAATTRRMLACEDVVLACAPDHPLAQCPPPSLTALAGATFIDLKPEWGVRRLIDRAFAARGAERRTAFEVNDTTMLLDLVAEGLGVTLVPESVARARPADARAGPLALVELAGGDDALCWELVVAFHGHDGNPGDRVVKAFLDVLVTDAGRPIRYPG
jgi:DNA-binding transcriptional LysR family regulator